MLQRILSALGALSLAFLFLISCKRPESEASVLTLNGEDRDIMVGLGPDADTLRFTLQSNKGWELTPLGKDDSWVTLEHERTGTTSWSFSLAVSELTGILPRSVSLLFHSEGKTRKFTVQQEPPASFFWRRQIGAYGVKGGDFLYYPPGQQVSQLRYPGGTVLRILEPASAKVCTLSGLPETLVAGQECTLHYRVCEKGLVTISETYEGVRVLRVTPSLAWLRQSDNVYFIVIP